MIQLRIILLVLHLVFVISAHAEHAPPKQDGLQQVEIADPFIEMHTGPGGGYPVFHVVERGEFITIIQRRTTWFKIVTVQGKQGWVSLDQMSLTLNTGGEQIEFKNVTQEEFLKRNWELGASGGSFGGATAFTFSGAYLFNKGFSSELEITQTFGNNSSGMLYKIGLIMQPFSDWKVSPYLRLATGIIDVDPKSTLVQDKDRSNQFSNIGLGVRAYITKRFMMKLEYGDYIIFTADIDNDTNEEHNEWKAGFSVFF